MSLIESVPLREWGTRYDSLSTSPSPSIASSLSRIPTTTCTANSSLLTVTPAQIHTQGDKVSHEASVFVGSLPTNVDHAELSARLKDHLSAFVHVNLVRIIRDSRGGVCAFVQCNDPTSAAQLIQTVRSLPPQNFMGRHLRFEPARSQKTLWVSYRKPVEVIRDADHGRLVEFDLPKAMKICRIPGSRRINILYNAQALHFDSNTRPVGRGLTDVGLTLQHIASSFGPLESFDLRPPEAAEDSPEYPTYSCPHDADRSEGMDPGCWEIKWVNRNDCLSALATLRSVPHLTVTWPNQQHALIPRRSGLVGRNHQVKDHLTTKRQSGLQHVHPRLGDHNNTTGQIIPSMDSSSSWNHRVDTITAAVGSQSPSERWTIIDTCSNTDFNVPPTVPHTSASVQMQVSQAHACDVPPETEVNREGQMVQLLCIDGVHSNTLEWAVAHSKGEVTTLSPVSPLHAPAYDGISQSSPPGPGAALGTPFIENLASPFVPKSLEPAFPLVGSAFNFYDSFAIPPAPQWSEARQRRPAGACDENIDTNLRNVLDPTTIFVGGLEVHGRCTWDEQRLRRVFGQYGEIAEVKLVRPAHRKSAFAFVTYKNNRSSSRAVLAEHDRIYDGRHIRVQLRESAVQKLSEGRPFSPRHQVGPRINGSPVDTLPHSQNGIGPAILVHCEEQAPPLPRSPSGAASLHSDARGQAPENNCVPLIPSQASSTMVSGIPPMPYPPPPPTAFYAPAPWFMPPYPYAPPPHVVPGYPPFPLTSSMVSANEAGHHIPSNTMYQGLIPVYAPEALGEYMASTNSQQNTPEPGGSHPILHPPKVVPETRSSQPRAMYPVYAQPQYQLTYIRERMMAAPSQFPNAPNLPLGMALTGITTLPPLKTVYRKALDLQLRMRFRWLRLTRPFVWDSPRETTVNAGSGFQGAAARLTASHTREQVGAATPLTCIRRAGKGISNTLGELFHECRHGSNAGNGSRRHRQRRRTCSQSKHVFTGRV
ncbi:hypothetical protein BJV77DRAFT_969003 [Russula vinacea]|nr:hypothetical protein BJV77DRAFT_969003 [Russula vinacea]